MHSQPQLGISPPLTCPFEVVEQDKPWWRLEVAEVVDRARAAGWEETPQCSVEYFGTTWDGCSAQKLGTSEVSAAKISKLLHLLRNDIRANGFHLKRLPDFRDVRFQPIYDDFEDAEIDCLIVDFDFNCFRVPIAVQAPNLDVSLDHLIGSVAHDFGLWLRDAEKYRAELCADAMSYREQVDRVAAQVGDSLVPLSLQMKQKVCFIYDGWPHGADFELLTLGLDSNLEMSISSTRIKRGGEFPMGADDVATCRWRADMRALLEATDSPCLVSDVALAIAFERGLNLEQLVKALSKRRHWHGPEVIPAEGGLPRVEFFVQQRTLQARFRTDEVYCSTGLVTLHVQYPLLIRMELEGRMLGDVIEYEPFALAGASIEGVHDNGYHLQFHFRPWAAPLTEVLSVGPERALATVREAKLQAWASKAPAGVNRLWQPMQTW